jgi:hypothetical protein
LTSNALAECNSKFNLRWAITVGADLELEIPEIKLSLTLSDLWSVLPNKGVSMVIGEAFGLPKTWDFVIVDEKPLASGCVAVDPCSSSNGGCSTNAVCTFKAPRVRSCTCKAGYVGTGLQCSLSNPCMQVSNGGCSSNAVCTVTSSGGRSCSCKSGYVGDGFFCVSGSVCSNSQRLAACPTLPTVGSECFLLLGNPTCRCSSGTFCAYLQLHEMWWSG